MMGRRLRRSTETNDLIQPSLEIGKDDEMRMAEASSMGTMTDKNSGNVGTMSDNQAAKGKMSDDSAPETIELVPEDDDISEGDPKDEKLIERHRRRVAERRIEKGKTIRDATPNLEIPGLGKWGVELKLKKKWAKKEKHWKYYAEYLEKDCGHAKIETFQDFLNLDTNKKDEYFDVWMYRPGPGDLKKDKEEEDKNEPKKDEPKKDEVPVVTNTKKVTKVTEHDERRVKYEHQEMPPGGYISNDDAVGNQINKTVTLDPGIGYVVLVFGVLVKDKVTISVNGKKVGGDSDYTSGRRSFKVPDGSASVTVKVDMKEGSAITIEVLPDKDIKHTSWRTIQTTYYSEGPPTTKPTNHWNDPDEKVPFDNWPRLKNEPWKQVGETRIISGQ